MSAPLGFFSGAPAAHLVCAAAEFCLRLKPAAQTRATAPLPVAQAQQAGFYRTRQIRATGAMPQCSKMESLA